MIPIFSIHAIFGVVEPQFTSTQIATLVDLTVAQLGLPIGPGLAAVTERPPPEDEDEEIVQAMNPGTHEINFVFDFDPNEKEYIDSEGLVSQYNIANQICSTLLFQCLSAINCTPTYFNIKITADYVDDELYEKMVKQRFNR